MCSQKSALHMLAMRDRSGKWPSIHFDRQTCLGNAGYPHGLGLSLGGFEFRVLPRRYSGGDYVVFPYAAVAVPYWFITGATGLLTLMYSGLLHRFRPYLRFSRYSMPFMLATGVVFAWLNVSPATIGPYGVLKDYGFPQTYLLVAVRDGEVLSSFMGNDLGWRQDKVMENLMLAAVAVFSVGFLCEFARHWLRGESKEESGNRPAEPDTQTPHPANREDEAADA